MNRAVARADRLYRNDTGRMLAEMVQRPVRQAVCGWPTGKGRIAVGMDADL
jgi:hypothetical protein